MSEDVDGTAPGRVVILHGPTSSGKTTVARRLQEFMEEPYFHFSLDEFYEMLPDTV